MGIQSYSLRGLKLDKAIEATKDLGLEWWEAYDGHIPVNEDFAFRSETRQLLRQSGVKLRTFGVMGFDQNSGKSRRIFDFAKAMGIETLSADPTPDAFPILEQLTEEFGINIAIHNHGPGSRYDKIESVFNAVRNRSKRIGACVDTGHYLRSKEDPVIALRILKGRVFGVHLKDVKDATRFTLLGQGDLNVAGVLKELNEQRYGGILSLEYEENPENPLPDIRKCLETVKAGVRTI